MPGYVSLTYIQIPDLEDPPPYYRPLSDFAGAASAPLVNDNDQSTGYPGTGGPLGVGALATFVLYDLGDVVEISKVFISYSTAGTDYAFTYVEPWYSRDGSIWNQYPGPLGNVLNYAGYSPSSGTQIHSARYFQLVFFPDGYDADSTYLLSEFELFDENGDQYIAPPVVVSFGPSTGSNPLTCSTVVGGTELTWTIQGATSCTVSANGVILGTFSGPSGSLWVYPYTTTIYTITGSNSVGSVTDECTVTLSNTALVATTVDGSVSWFNNQSNFAVGPYAISYVTGSYEYEPGFGWTVNGNEDIFIVNPNAPKIPGFYITDTPNAIGSTKFYDWGTDFAPDFGPDFGFFYGGQIVGNALNQNIANILLAPGNTTLYGSQAACITGNAGLSPSIYHHKGNAPIGIALNDNPYYDDYSGSPPVTYKLCGPGPIPLLMVSPPTGLQGTPRILTWTIGGNVTSASINNGIGSVSTAGGSTTVNPTTTTVYTITAYDSASGITIMYSATAFVLLPTSPQNLFVTGQCGGSITLEWTPGINHTNDIVQRSTDDATWTTIATIGPTVGYYVDSTPTRGTIYYYRVAGYDGLSADNAYSNVVQSVAYIDPAAPAGLTVSVSGLVATLNWTTSANAIGYNIFRGTTSGGEVLVGNSIEDSFIDYGPLEAGTEYYWVVESYGYCYVNSAPSNEISATLCPCQDAYAPIDLPSTSWNAEDIPIGDC